MDTDALPAQCTIVCFVKNIATISTVNTKGQLKLLMNGVVKKEFATVVIHHNLYA